MTPEQLDEIEKLAAAATPGPWVWRGPDEPADLWTADGKDPIVCVQTTNADIKFIRAMREHALPLVKALREARAERDAALKDAETQGAMHHRYYWRLMACDEARAFDKDDHQKVRVTLTKERDEARAEVERLREALRQVYAMTGRGVDWATFPGVAATTLREIHKITKGMVE